MQVDETTQPTKVGKAQRAGRAIALTTLHSSGIGGMTDLNVLTH